MQMPFTQNTEVSPSVTHGALANSTRKEDVTLVKDCLSGNQQAWSALIKQYGPLVHHTISRTLTPHGMSGDVEDAVQEVFSRLIRGSYRLLSTWDHTRGTLPTWLAVVSRSTAVDYLRNKHSGYHDSLEDHYDIPIPEKGTSIEEYFPKGFFSTRQNSVMQLIYTEGMDYTEAAKTLDVHPQTVRSIQHTCMLKLKEYYQTA